MSSMCDQKTTVLLCWTICSPASLLLGYGSFVHSNGLLPWQTFFGHACSQPYSCTAQPLKPDQHTCPCPVLQELYKAQSDSGLLSEAADEAAAKVSDQRLQVQREKQQQARAAQAHSLLAHAALDKTPPAKNIVRKMHIINQPRRFN